MGRDAINLEEFARMIEAASRPAAPATGAPIARDRRVVTDRVRKATVPTVPSRGRPS